MKPWTTDSLERACRRVLLERASVAVGPVSRDLAADIEWTEGGRAKIRVDGHELGLRPATIHELLHLVLDKAMESFDEPLAEEIVLAFEKRLDARIALSRRRSAWWGKTLRRKTGRR